MFGLKGFFGCLLGLTGVMCQEIDFLDIFEKAIEFQEALGDDFRNGNCFRDSMEIVTTVTSNVTLADKLWALKSKSSFWFIIGVLFKVCRTPNVA